MDSQTTEPLQASADLETGLRKKPLVPLGIFLVAFLLGLGMGYFFWGSDAGAKYFPEVASWGASRNSNLPLSTQIAAAIRATEQANRPTPPQNIKRYDVPVDDDYVLGPADAPITLIEFSDYQCPYCEKWYDEVFQALLDTYPGQIRFVYRDFPLTNIHPEAFPAALAANCAGEQGQYYPYHNSLFDRKYGLGSDAYRQYAADLGLDVTKFTECLDSERYQDEVSADLEWASALGIQSTPTFFVNGIPIIGAQPFETFAMVIDWELAGELPK